MKNDDLKDFWQMLWKFGLGPYRYPLPCHRHHSILPQDSTAQWNFAYLISMIIKSQHRLASWQEVMLFYLVGRLFTEMNFAHAAMNTLLISLY